MKTALITNLDETKEHVRLFNSKFRNYYGEGHMVLAMHAAFPSCLTVDLLYQLWANFKSYDNRNGSNITIPILAVSDFLLSSLLRPTGKGIYEFSPDARAYLLDELKKDGRFGEQRIQELASFLYQYTLSKPDTIEWKKIKEGQKLTALLAVDPAAATSSILEQLAEKVQSNSVNNSLGIVNMMNAFAKDDETFADNLAGHIRSNEEPAIDIPEARIDRGDSTFKLVLSDEQTDGSISFNFPTYISSKLNNIKNVQQAGEKNAANNKQVLYACIVCANEYIHNDIPSLTGGLIDVENIYNYLTKRFNKGNDQNKSIAQMPTIRVLKNKEATTQAILSTLEEMLAKAGNDDEVLFYFSGHSIANDLEVKAVIPTFKGGLVPYDYEKKNLVRYGDIYELIKKYKSNNSYLTLLLDTSHAIPVDLIDASNRKHIAFAGCFFNQMGYDEAKKGGAFTNALIDALKKNKNHPTYRELCTESFKYAGLGSVNQTPFLIGNIEGWDRLFLKAKPANVSEELDKLGLKSSLPMIEMNTLPLLKIQQETTLSLALLVTDYISQKTLNVLFITKDPKKYGLDDWRSNPDVNIDFMLLPSFKIDSDGTLHYSQKGISLEKKISRATIIILGIDNVLYNNHDLFEAFKKILFLTKLRGKEAAIIYEEPLSNEDPYLKYYKTYPSSGKPVISDNEIANMREQLDKRLNFLLTFKKIKKTAPVSNNLLQSKINEAKKTGKLDLSNMGLTTLPDELKEIKIVELNLQDNKFKEVPAQIKGLKLRKLFLNGNPITALPDWLYDMSFIRILKIDNTKISSLSPDIGKMKSLTDLTLSNTKVEILPSELKKLPLKRVNVKGCRIINIEPGKQSSLDIMRAFKSQGRNIPSYDLSPKNPTFFFLSTKKEMNARLNSFLFSGVTSNEKVGSPHFASIMDEFSCLFLSSEDFSKPYLWFSFFEKYGSKIDFIYFNNYDDNIDYSAIANRKNIQVSSKLSQLPDSSDIRKVIKYFGPISFYYDGTETISRWEELRSETTAVIGRTTGNFGNVEKSLKNAGNFFVYLLLKNPIGQAFTKIQKSELGVTFKPQVLISKPKASLKKTIERKKAVPKKKK